MKLKIKSIGNNDNYNHIELEKSELFLENLQDFVNELGLVNIDSSDIYNYEGKNYDLYTYYTLFHEDPKDEEAGPQKAKIEDFKDGHILRYPSKDIELLIIFFENHITLIFHCSDKQRHKVMEALDKFAKFNPHLV